MERRAVAVVTKGRVDHLLASSGPATPGPPPARAQAGLADQPDRGDDALILRPQGPYREYVTAEMLAS
jgi:hypothetical protein